VRLRIAGKFFIVALSLALGMVVIEGATWYSSKAVKKQTEASSAATDQLTGLSEARESALELALAEVSLMVNKDSGEVDEDHRAALTSLPYKIQMSIMKAGKSDLPKEAEDALEPLNDILASLGKDKQALMDAVENKADAKTFIDLDASIEDKTGKILDAITTAEDSVSSAQSDSMDSLSAITDKSLKTSLIAFGAALVFCGVITFFIARNVSYGVRKTAQAISALAEGDASFQHGLSLKRGDEIGDMLRAFSLMRKHVREAFKLQRVIEDMPLQVVLGDPQQDFRITYMNRSSKTQLGELPAGDLTPELTQLALEEAPEVSLLSFFDDAEMAREILSDSSRLPYHVVVPIGNQYIDVQCGALFDADGAASEVFLSAVERPRPH